MPSACSISQLRAICAKTAISTNPITRLRPSRLRITAIPRQNPAWCLCETDRSSAPIAIIMPTQSGGSHSGSPSGPTSVKDVSAASVASTVRMGISAAIRAGTRGLSAGAERRNAAMRAATPS